MAERYIVVIAENATQFKDYVESVKYSKLEIHTHSNKVRIKELAFLWARSKYGMMGYTFSEDSELVKVGAWYNLPEDEVKGIEEAFEIRKAQKVKTECFCECASCKSQR